MVEAHLNSDSLVTGNLQTNVADSGPRRLKTQEEYRGREGRSIPSMGDLWRFVPAHIDFSPKSICLSCDCPAGTSPFRFADAKPTISLLRPDLFCPRLAEASCHGLQRGFLMCTRSWPSHMRMDFLFFQVRKMGPGSSKTVFHPLFCWCECPTWLTASCIRFPSSPRVYSFRSSCGSARRRKANQRPIKRRSGRSTCRRVLPGGTMPSCTTSIVESSCCTYPEM